MGKVVLNFFLFTIITCAAIGYDITSHGSLESSRTGRYLKDAGLLIHVKPYYSIIEEQTVSLYKWGKKNFPYEEYGALKNKTIVISKDLGSKVSTFAVDSCVQVKKYSIITYKWVSDRVTPYLSDKVITFLNNRYNDIANIFSRIGKSATNAKKWASENIKKENITWENFEKAYFSFAQQVKLYYFNVSSWVGRKVTCLIKS